MKKSKKFKKQKSLIIPPSSSKQNSSEVDETFFLSEAMKSKRKEENVWRSEFPFSSHYMMIKGFAYHYIDESPDSICKASQNDAEDTANSSSKIEEPVSANDSGVEKNKENVASKTEPFAENATESQVSDREIAEIGPPETGKNWPTLLMVHGNPTWSFYWRNVIRALRTQYRVIAVDHIGCGLSECPSEKDYPYIMERRISDLTYLIKKLNLTNVTLIAHDWGGAIGMGAATRQPKRFSRLVLLNTGAFLSKRCPLRIHLCHIPLLNRLMIQGMNLFTLAAIRMATAHPRRLSKATVSGLLAPYNNWKNRTAVFRFVQDIPLSEHHVSYQTLLDIENNLKLFQEKPVSLIWGMRDWCFSPEFLKRFLQFYPEAEVHRLENAGHYVVEDETEQVIALLKDFLQRTQ